MRTIRKYIILLFTGILVIITFSCSDFLDTTSGSQLTDNEIYQNEGDIYRAILNIYAQISEEKLYGRTIPLIYSFNTDIDLELVMQLLIIQGVVFGITLLQITMKNW